MEIKFHTVNQKLIAEVLSETIEINNVQDALDIMANCSYQGADRIIMYEKNISPLFFDLKTRFAGEILQKFTNYRILLAIIGDYTKFTSKSLRDFIYESNKLGRVNFVSSLEDAKNQLAK